VSTVLAIAALTVLVGLGLLSLKRQREGVAEEKQLAEARAHSGDAQHDRSMSRRADVRSGSDNTSQAPAEDVRSADEPSAGSSP
jgi:hypothetical protein